MNRKLFDLIVQCVLTVLMVVAFGCLLVFAVLPWLDAHRHKGDSILLSSYFPIVVWLLLAALAALVIGLEIHAYCHPELEEERE